MAAKPLRAGVSADRIREVLDYNPETGAFTWRHVPGRKNSYAGKDAGSLAIFAGGKPYLSIRVDDILYLSHRLAWVHFHGVWPTAGVDHIDGNGLNNAITNLREATQAQNLLNRIHQSNSESGLKGISKHGNKWRVRIKNGSTNVLKAFYDLEEAKAWHTEMEKLIHGEFAPKD